MIGTARLNTVAAIAIVAAVFAASAGRACAKPAGERHEKTAAKEKCLIESSATYIALSPNGDLLAVNASNRLKMFDANTGKEKAQWSASGAGYHLQFIAAGSQLLGSRGIWDSATGRALFWLRQPAGPEFVQIVGFLDADKGGVVCLEKRFSALSELLEIDKASVQIRDAKTGELVRQFQPAKDPDSRDHHAVSSDGKLLAYKSYNEKTISVWDLESLKELATLKGCEERVTSLCFGPDRKWIASAGSTKDVRIWDLKTKQTARMIPVRALFGIVVSPDGKWLAAGVAKDKAGSTISIRDTTTGEELLELKGPPFGRILALSADGRTLALAGNRSVQVWEITAK